MEIIIHIAGSEPKYIAVDSADFEEMKRSGRKLRSNQTGYGTTIWGAVEDLAKKKNALA